MLIDVQGADVAVTYQSGNPKVTISGKGSTVRKGEMSHTMALSKSPAVCQARSEVFTSSFARRSCSASS